MSAAPNRFKQVKPCRPLSCETQLLLMLSKLAQASLEPQHSAPRRGSEDTQCRAWGLQ